MNEFVTYIEEHFWMLEVFLIVLGTGFVHLFVKLALNRIGHQLDKTHNLYDDALLEAGRKPLSWAIWIIGVSMAAEVVGGAAAAEIFDQVATVRDVAVVWLLVWFAIRFIHYIEEHIVIGREGEPKVDLTTARAVGKLLRASVLITGVLLVLQAFGFSISGVLAFGGIGGIAVGFAARDLLANFFGAIMVFLDRPFSVGDWVRSPDRDIEGTVEEIGWRLTRIRTFDKRPVYIPNAIFTSIVVENPSRMLNRRIYENIGIRYDDIGVMKPIVDEVKTMLKNHQEIDTSVTLMVNFVEFGPSSLDFFVYCFTKTTVWSEFHEVKQDVLLKIAQIIEAHGAEIAFPTQTLHLAAEPDVLAANVSAH
ncbi:MAG: mechanosensitive ion channel family protein [Pseudomonadales bacterium]|jgi:MscS family membrane protein|nr:mechanosensitive ion channel family protein [Pseudomonadales bacterium]